MNPRRKTSGRRIARLCTGFLLGCVGVATGLAQVKTYPPGVAEPVEPERRPQRVVESVEQPPAPADREVRPHEGEPRVVRVRAQGVTRDDAVREALRKALEQGAGVQIASYSHTDNFALVRDTIYARAAGVVSEYRVIREERLAGMSEVEVEAAVRPDAVASAWGEVQNILDQIGRPKLMVWIDERIDGVPQSDSVVAARLEAMFTRAGFDLVDRRGLGDLIAREWRDAANERNDARLAALARDAGAHLLIRGSANADRAGMEVLYNVPIAFYNCDAQARVYWTDTARLIASESVAGTRAGVRAQREYSPQAARTALTAATFPQSRDESPDDERDRRSDREPPAPALGDRLYVSVMEQWTTQLSSAGDIELEVEQMVFRDFVALKRALTELEPRIRSVDGDFSKGISRLRIKARMPAAALAERLVDPPFDEWLEVIDLKPNRIQARAVEPR